VEGGDAIIIEPSFPHTCGVRQVLTIAINNVAQKEEADLKPCEDVVEF
jgi:hypothetical protein